MKTIPAFLRFVEVNEEPKIGSIGMYYETVYAPAGNSIIKVKKGKVFLIRTAEQVDSFDIAIHKIIQPVVTVNESASLGEIAFGVYGKFLITADEKNEFILNPPAYQKVVIEYKNIPMDVIVGMELDILVDESPVEVELSDDIIKIQDNKAHIIWGKFMEQKNTIAYQTIKTAGIPQSEAEKNAEAEELLRLSKSVTKQNPDEIMEMTAPYAAEFLDWFVADVNHEIAKVVIRLPPEDRTISLYKYWFKKYKT